MRTHGAEREKRHSAIALAHPHARVERGDALLIVHLAVNAAHHQRIGVRRAVPQRFGVLESIR